MWRWLTNLLRSPSAGRAQARPNHEVLLERRLMALPVLAEGELRKLEFAADAFEGSSWAVIDHIADVIKHVLTTKYMDRNGRETRKTAVEKLSYELTMGPSDKRRVTLSGGRSTTAGPKAERLVTEQMVSIARTAEDRFRVRRYVQEMSFEWN
jgi:hypothetical protein